MIVLDASVVIAHLAAADVHHEQAVGFFRDHATDRFLLHPLTLAEILVGPIRVGREAFAAHQLAAMGISEWRPPAGSAVELARLRVETGLKLPDCCVLQAALAERSPVATFDAPLARQAKSLGVPLALSGGGPPGSRADPR